MSVNSRYKYIVHSYACSEGHTPGTMFHVDRRWEGVRVFSLFLPQRILESLPVVKVEHLADGEDIEFARAFLEPQFPYGYEHLVEQCSQAQLESWAKLAPPRLNYLHSTLERVRQYEDRFAEEYVDSIERRRKWAQCHFNKEESRRDKSQEVVTYYHNGD